MKVLDAGACSAYNRSESIQSRSEALSMPDPILQVPMRESVTVSAGETLTINFTKDCCFCCDPDQANNFVPPLPIGNHRSGDSWSGVAAAAGTIQFHHKPYGETCDTTKPTVASGVRTIIVGD